MAPLLLAPARAPSVKETSAAHRGGEADQGPRSLDLGPPPWVRGLICKKQVVHHLGPSPHTAATIRKEVLPPPPPPPHTPKMGYPGMAAIGQVWTRHCCSSRACPTAFRALSLHHVLALFVFQTVPSPSLPG